MIEHGQAYIFIGISFRLPITESKDCLGLYRLLKLLATRLSKCFDHPSLFLQTTFGLTRLKEAIFNDTASFCVLSIILINLHLLIAYFSLKKKNEGGKSLKGLVS